MVSLNFGVRANGSVAYVELFGMKTDVIKTRDEDNSPLDISWEDRNDQDTIASVARYRKHFVSIGDETKEFITDYDTACYIAEKMKTYDEEVRESKKNGLPVTPMQIRVTGTMEKEPYISTNSGVKGYKDKFVVGNLREVCDERPELKMEMTLYYNKDSFDFKEFKSEKRMKIQAHILQYLRNTKSITAAIGEAGKRMFMPQEVVLDATKIDMSNEGQKKILESKLEELKVPSDKKLYACHWECSYVNGAEEAAFDESQLTTKQKRQIELGMKTLDDFKPSGRILGPRVKEIRLEYPELKGEFDDGVIEVEEYTLKEFEDAKVKFLEATSLDEAVEESKKQDDEDITEIDEFDFDFN